MRKYRLLLLAMFFTCYSWAQVTTEGTEFWLGFMENFDGQAPSSLEIFITAKAEANVEIFVYADGSSRSITVVPGITHQEIISFSTSNPYAATLSGNIERKAIRITSDENISVYAFNNRQRSADATVILPTSSLGSEYYVTGYWEDGPDDDIGTVNSPSEFLIVASQDDTEIEITPSVQTLGGPAANSPYTIILDQGELYQVKANGDLSGTYIRAAEGSGECKNFAVFGGNQWGRVTLGEDCATDAGNFPGGYAADHLFEQMYPTNTWGKNYLAIPFQLRNNYAVRVMAKEDQTEVKVGSQTVMLDAGEYSTFVEDGVVSIESDRPIQVAQFSLTMSCDTQSTAGIGDPFMIMLNPNEQQLSEINFNALNATELSDYYLSVITNTDQVGTLSLNGNIVNGSLFNQVPGAPEYSYGSIQIQKGEDYNLRSDGGFVAYIYAFGFLESFGYVAGAALQNLNLQIELEDEYLNIVEDAACLNSDIQFEAEFETPAGQEPRFNTFVWDFGNGDTAEGQSVSYQYNTPGTYQVTLVASDGQGSCGSSETINKTIEIQEVVVNDIIGASSVCPDVTGIGYEVSGAPGNSYEWIVEGGTINGSTMGENILVDWGASNNEAFVKVVPRNALGCVGDTLFLPVVVNKRLEPPAPLTESPLSQTGEAEVCFENRNRVRYYITPTNGSQYSWQVEGGTFTPDSNPNSSEVFVDWGNSRTGRIWYTESNDLIDDCEGDSDVLEVIIYRQITATAAIENVLCNGESNGQISLSISGGKPGNYTINWDNGLNGTTISDLSAGDYEVAITDELGCVTTATFTVTEPDVLEITGVNTQAVRCFQESNGVAEIQVEGGTLFSNNEYRYQWKRGADEFQTSSKTNNSLRAGTYELTVVDANGCEASTTFTIEEPPLLQADLDALINDPICPQATDGTAFIDAKGGTPDYQFYWSNNPSVDDQTARNLSKGSYSVRIVDANGCELVYPIIVAERYPKIFIPNAFSPNNDGVNDVFKPVAECQSTYYMQIFNKWGSVVFSTEDITEGWDGTYEGEPVPMGSYSYLIFYAGKVNNVDFEETYRGSFKLIH